MNSQGDDAKRLRIQDTQFLDAFSQTNRDSSLGMPCLVAQTKKISHYPTNSQQFYACSPLTILGIEEETATGIITLGTTTLFALNLGSSVPPLGANVVLTYVDNRWVFRYDN